MKNHSTIFTIFILLVFLGHFSAIDLYPGWFKHYGGTDYETAYSIQQISGGGYIVAGSTHTYTHGSYDFAIYKLDSNGNKIWFKHYGGINSDNGYSIQQISGGGYIVAGYTSSYSNGGSDFAIYKLNSSGNKVWLKHYGGTEDDIAYSIQQTSDGGYIVAGASLSYTHGGYDFAIYKLNSSGNKVWFKYYGGTSGDIALSIRQTSDGGYIVAGRTESYTYGGVDMAIYKLNSSGSKVWFKHYGGSDNDISRSVQQTSDGNFIVAGYTESYTYGDNDFAIYKLNSIGNKIWFKHYGGTDWDRGLSIHQTSDGGYVVTGETASYSHGSYDFGIYKLNSSGGKVWFKHYGGSSSDYGESIKQTTDGGFITAGYTNSFTYGSGDIAIYKLDSAGNK